MLPKLIIVVLLLGIVVSLFAGLYFMMKDNSTNKNRRMLRALTLRVGLSVAMIVFLLIAAGMGWIHPHGLNR